MEFIITKTKRNNLIISSSYLILNYILLGLSSLFYFEIKINIIENEINNVLFIIAYGYLLIVIVDYFSHYKEKKIKIVSIIILIAEIANQIVALFNSFKPIIPEFLSGFLTVIALISMIIWIVLLLRLKSEYSAINSLRKFAFGEIAAFGLSLVISLIVIFGEFLDFLDIMFLPLAIPYIFTIEFALKLKTKE